MSKRYPPTQDAQEAPCPRRPAREQLPLPGLGPVRSLRALVADLPEQRFGMIDPGQIDPVVWMPRSQLLDLLDQDTTPLAGLPARVAGSPRGVYIDHPTYGCVEFCRLDRPHG